MAVHQMRRRLTETPEMIDVTGVSLRTFRVPEDVPNWLQLRRNAFARQRLGVRDWTVEDFAREFSTKPWWNPAHLWLAEPGLDSLLSGGDVPGSKTPVGTVALAWRGRQFETPAVHWLSVDPAWRRRGVARALLAALETCVWELGLREIWLETHDQWQAAVRFYQRAGYEIVPPAVRES